MRKTPSFVDLGSLDEDARIDAIGNATMRDRKTVGFVTDNEPGKAERYIAKLKERFPGIVVVARMKGPTPGVVTVKVAPPLESMT